MVFACPTWASERVYRFPVDNHSTSELKRPLKPLPPAQGVAITHLYGEGQFNAQMLNFERRSDGKFYRSETRAQDYLREAYASCSSLLEGPNRQEKMGQFIMDHLVNGTILGNFDNFALEEQMGRKQLPAAEKEKYMHSGLDLNHNQLTYLETYSIFTAAELKEYFGDQDILPRIAEVTAPDKLTHEQVLALVKKGAPAVKVKLRRSAIRLVAGQGFDSHTGNQFYNYSLPYPYPNNRSEYPVIFELGRTAQIPGLEGEARDLTAFASIVMLQQLMQLKVYGFKNMPLDSAMVYMHSVRPANTLLYQKGGAELISDPEKKDDAMLRIRLDNFIEKVWPNTSIGIFSDLMTLPPYSAQDNLLWAMRIMGTYRESFRRESNLKIKGEDYTPFGPLIFRNPKELALKAFNKRMEPFSAGAQELIQKAIVNAETVETTSPFGRRNEDNWWLKQEWKDDNKLILVSGLAPHRARGLPDYVRNILLSIHLTHSREFLAGYSFALASRDEGIQEQIKKLGISPYKTTSNVNFYKVTWADLDRIEKAAKGALTRQDVSLTDSSWQRLHNLRYLPAF
jgi:hypothetical protein